LFFTAGGLVAGALELGLLYDATDGCAVRLYTMAAVAAAMALGAVSLAGLVRRE